MDVAVIKFKASGQKLSVVSADKFAANTVNYIRAEFELGDGWDGFDVVRAVWANDFNKIATILDTDGVTMVPWEVLKRTGMLQVNLVGSISDGDELTDRLTTYKVKALDVNGCTNVDGDNTSPITPSQFEQFVAIVHDDAEAAADARDEARGYASDAEDYRDEAVGAAADAEDYRDAAKGYADDAEDYKDQAKGYADDAEADAEEIRNMTATATTLPEGSSATASYSDGVLSLGIPKGDTGATGATGNGIASAVLNADYTLTLNFTDGTHYTTPPIRGAQGVQGETGNGIESVYLTETHGAVKTYTILFTDGTTTTFEVTDGEVTLAQLEQVLPTDTASGAIASFEDGSDLFNYLSCICEINPVQDLHGYDKPWVGGAGKNELDESTFSSNGTFTESNGVFSNASTDTRGYFSAVIRGYHSDDTYENMSTTAFGTTGRQSFPTFTPQSDIVRIAILHSGSQLNLYCYFDCSLKSGQTYIASLNIIGFNPQSVGGLSFDKIQIETGSTATAWTPYSNLCPITGWTGCEVSKAGVNLFDKSDYDYILGYFDTTIHSASNHVIVYIPCKPSTTYTVSRKRVLANDRFGVSWTKTTPADGVATYNATNAPNSGTVGDLMSLTITTGADAKYIAVWAYWGGESSALNSLQIELGSTASDYHAYNGTTYNISWQTEAGTVYGGSIDVISGVLTVDRVGIDLGDITWSYNSNGLFFVASVLGRETTTSGTIDMISDKYEVNIWTSSTSQLANQSDKTAWYQRGEANIIIKELSLTSPTDFKTFITGTQLVYPLATPQTYQLDPVQVACLLGRNNVWADCGDIEEVKYKADVQLWVEKMLNA